MTPDKLEALRRLAADERTPVEEARNAALAFVRHGGQVKPSEELVPKADLEKVKRDNVELFERSKIIAAEAERRRVENERLQIENEKLRVLLRRVVGGSKAEKEAAELVARWEGEAKKTNGGGCVDNPPGIPGYYTNVGFVPGGAWK